MLKRTNLHRHLEIRNKGVAPKYDTWSDKYDPWLHLRRMGKLVGTGFYIPPNWYNHFRMFPPITHSFKEEKTLNPYTVEEVTQEQFNTLTEDRKAVRDELARRSRSLAATGMRYFNIFWVEKPLDDAERQYYVLRKSSGLSHEAALKKVLGEFYESQALRRRSHMIQSEEAQMTGKFLTMREAMSVVQLLGDAQRLGLAPHQFSEIAQRTSAGASASSSNNGDGSETATMEARVVKETVTQNITAESLNELLSGDTTTAAAEKGGAATATTTTDVTSTGVTSRTKIIDKIVVSDSVNDSSEGLKNLATSSTGTASWLDQAEGHSPKYNTGV